MRLYGLLGGMAPLLMGTILFLSAEAAAYVPLRGEGILTLAAEPGVKAFVGGKKLHGAQSAKIRLKAGKYRVRLSHPKRGAIVQTVQVRAHRRTTIGSQFQKHAQDTAH